MGLNPKLIFFFFNLLMRKGAVMSCPLNLIFLFRACSLNDRFSSAKRIAHFVVRCFFFRPSRCLANDSATIVRMTSSALSQLLHGRVT